MYFHHYMAPWHRSKSNGPKIVAWNQGGHEQRQTQWDREQRKTKETVSRGKPNETMSRGKSFPIPRWLPWVFCYRIESWLTWVSRGRRYNSTMGFPNTKGTLSWRMEAGYPCVGGGEASWSGQRNLYRNPQPRGLPVPEGKMPTGHINISWRKINKELAFREGRSLLDEGRRKFPWSGE